MNQNHLNNFERGPTKDHSCEVWSNSHQWFRRRCCLKIVDRRTSGRRRRRTVSDHNSSSWAFSSGELIKQGLSNISFCPLRILYNNKFIIMATSLETNPVVVTRSHFSLETPKRVTDKKCRPRSDATQCGIWSGSTLFSLNTGISIKYSNYKN